MLELTLTSERDVIQVRFSAASLEPDVHGFTVDAKQLRERVEWAIANRTGPRHVIV